MFLYLLIVCVGFIFSMLSIEIKSPNEIEELRQYNAYKEFYNEYHKYISSGQMVMKNTMTVVPVESKRNYHIDEYNCDIRSGIGFSTDMINKINYERELNNNNKLKIA